MNTLKGTVRALTVAVAQRRAEAEADEWFESTPHRVELVDARPTDERLQGRKVFEVKYAAHAITTNLESE